MVKLYPVGPALSLPGLPVKPPKAKIHVSVFATESKTPFSEKLGSENLRTAGVEVGCFLSLLFLALFLGVIVMSVYVRPAAAQLADLTALLASAPWVAMKIHLCTIDFNPTPANVLADFTAGEADFDGYAPASLTFGGAHMDDLGKAVANALASFICTGTAHPNIVYVYWISNTAGSVLMFSGRLDDAPKAIAAIGDGVSLLVNAGLGAGEVDVVV